MLRPEGRFLANCNGQDIKAVHCFHCGKSRGFWIQTYAIWAVQWLHATFQRLMQNCPGELNLTYCLIYLRWHDSLLEDRGGALAVLVCCVQSLPGTQPEAKMHYVWILLGWDQLFGSSHLQRGCQAQQRELKSCGQVHSTQKSTLRSVPFWAWWATIWQFIKGFAHSIMQPLHKHLSGEGASKKSWAGNAHGRGQGYLWDT